MVSEVDNKKRFLQQLSQNTAPSEPDLPMTAVLAWISDGGTAANGIKYGSSDHAVTWGNKGCPLLPRDVREHHRGVQLPHDLQRVFGASLTVDQLDSSVLELAIDAVWQPPPREFRDFLYSMPIPAAQVAIPAGIPLAWIEDLPITGRTRGAVRKAFKEMGVDSFLKVPMLARQFLNIRSVGVTILNELTCVIESAELGWTDEDPTVDLYDSATPQITEGMSEFNSHLYEFARWAMAETDAQTFGEAIAELIRAGAANEVWKSVALVSLAELAARPPHPYEVLDKWMEQIDARSRVIFMARVSGHPHNVVTLEELGAGFAVSRERIRQVEVKVHRTLNRFLASDEALPVRWRASTLRRMLSVAAPVHTVEHLLTSPPGCNDHRGILLEMAGPYDRDHDWFTLRSARSDDPTSAILTQVDEVGSIDREFAISQLTEWGLDVSLHERWLTRDGSVRLFNGQLVQWGSSAPKRMAFALADMGRPATVDEMMTHVGEERSRNYIKTALGADPRLVRVSPTHWGLASWNLPEYSGIAESMRDLIEEQGGSMVIDMLAYRMNQRFGVEENSTIAYCGAPMFVVEGESLRLRTQHDEPYRYNPDLIRRTPGVFNLGPMRLGRLLKVDKDILRGSGTSLTHAAGFILGVEVKAHLSFSNRHGDRVTITFPETSNSGPSISSVLRIAERLSAKEGDYLTLVLDRSEMTVSACLTDLKEQSPGWDVIGRLTGIATTVNLDGLAKALSCSAGEVRSVLRARGDADILDFLPSSKPSATLDDALAALEDHIENTREILP